MDGQNRLYPITSSKNNDIFKFLNPKHNTKLFDLKGIDLQELLFLLDNYYLTLRNNIGLKKDVTFGLELEFEYISSLVKRSRIDNELKKIFSNDDWKTIEEISVSDGAEISSPIMKDEYSNWCQLDTVCRIISKHARISRFCGGHIHIGAQILGDKKEN